MKHSSWHASSISSGNLTTSAISPAIPPVALATPGNTLTVGTGGEFTSLSAAVAAAQNGDTILVQAGTYTNDFSFITSRLTIEGVGGVANFVATEAPTNLKGILTVDNSCTIENCSFSGASIAAADGGNAAGIRYEGGAMVLLHDSFSHNQNGVMGAPVIQSLTKNTVTIEHCSFFDNGAGDGYTHNCYIGTVTALTFAYNVSQNADIGHELKSRAYTNTIEHNVFADGATGQASYEIDLPDGGTDVVEANTIEKGPHAQNQAMVHFGGEGIPYAGSSLLIQGNHFINDYGPSAVAVLNQTPYSVTITGNMFSNIPVSNLASGPAVETNNTDGQGNPLPNGTLTGVLPGNTVIFTDNAPHTISLTGTVLAVEGGGGLLTVTAIAGHVIAVGGSGGMVFQETGSSGGNTITTAAGSANTLTLIGQDLVSSNGNDSIQCGTYNVTGQITGTASINDGSGNNTWDIEGTASIVAQGGNPVLSIGSAGAASITGTLGYLSVQNNGGHFAFSVGEAGVAYAMTDTGGAVNARVANSFVTVNTAAGPVGATLTLDTGTFQVLSAGKDKIYAGSGNDTVILEGAASVYAGTGSLSIFGRSDPGGANVYGNGGTYLISGDTGNITYHGGTLASTVQAQLSNITLLGGAGLMTVLGGSDDVIKGGSGGLIYSATDNGGADTITTSAGATDTLTLAQTDIVNSYGKDTIHMGIYNQTITVHGASTIYGGSGNNQLTFGGKDQLFGVGHDSVTVLPGAAVTINAGASTVVSEAGAASVQFNAGGASAAAISVFGGAAIVQGGNTSGTITVSTGAGSSTRLLLGAGTTNVTSFGADTINAGAGNAAITLKEAAAQIAGGTGMLTIYNYDSSTTDTQTVTGGVGAISYTQGAGTLNFQGGSGSAVIDGGAGALHVTGGSGRISITGGTAGISFVGGSGAATISLTSAGGAIEFGAGTSYVQEAGGGAADVFNFVGGHGGGTDTITGFRAGTDSLTFSGVTIASETLGGGSTTLTLSDQTSVLLAGFLDSGHLY